MLNKNYGDVTEAGGIKYAPRKFVEGDGVFSPRVDDDEAYFARGWFKVVNNKPEYDAVSQIVYIKDWIKDTEAKTVTANYVIAPCPEDKHKKAKKYSKLRITLFCMQQNIWEKVKGFLEHVGYYDLFVMAQYFLDTDDYFQQGISMFKQQYIADGGTAEEIDSLVQTMLNFAFDGYEILNEDAEEELDVSTPTNNVGL